MCVCLGGDRTKKDGFTSTVIIAPPPFRVLLRLEGSERSEKEMRETAYVHVQQPLKSNQCWNKLHNHFSSCQVLEKMLPQKNASTSV